MMRLVIRERSEAFLW